MIRRLLLTILLLFSPVQAFGAWTVVSSICTFQTAGDGSPLTTGTIDTTGASLIVLYAYNYDDGASATVSDSRSNTWQHLTDQVTFGYEGRLHYVYQPSAGSGHTFTLSRADGVYQGVLCALALTGSLTTDPADQQSSYGFATYPTIQPGSITPSLNNEIVITGVGTNGQYNDAFSIDSGFTLQAQAYDTGGLIGHAGAIGYIVQGAASAVNPTWTINDCCGQVMSTSMASFKPFVAPPATLIKRRPVVTQ